MQQITLKPRGGLLTDAQTPLRASAGATPAGTHSCWSVGVVGLQRLSGLPHLIPRRRPPERHPFAAGCCLPARLRSARVRPDGYAITYTGNGGSDKGIQQIRAA